MPAMTPAPEPEPRQLRTCIEMTVVPLATPYVPPPAVDATCVPWPSLHVVDALMTPW